MVTIPLVDSQLVPPLVAKCIKRSSLNELGLAVLSHKVTIVMAPAGFGKSVWLASLQAVEGWPSTAWLSVEKYDNDPSFFLYHLIHALKKVEPQFGTQALHTLSSLNNLNRDWSIAASSLIEELPQNKELVVVLDDFHLVNKNVFVQGIIEYLIRRLPPQIHLVIMSRTDVTLNLYQELLKGQLLMISGQKLLLTLAEVRELFSLEGLNLSEEDNEFLYYYTEGWAAGVRLLGLFLKNSGSSDFKNLSLLEGKNCTLYTFLSNELLGYLTRELHDFLLDSALLPYLEPDLCNNVFEELGSKEKILELHALGLLSQVESHTTTWRFNHLMEDFLRKKVTELRLPEYIKSLQHRAAAYLEKIGDIDRALEQLRACRDWPKAAELIIRYGDSYFLENGWHQSLYYWIKALPDNYVNDDHQLLYYQGISIRDVQPLEARESLSHSAALAGLKGDIRGKVRALMAILTAHFFAGKTVKNEEIEAYLPDDVTFLQDAWSKEVVQVAALAKAVWQDDLKQGDSLSRKIKITYLEAEWQLYYLLLSGIIQYRLGNLTRARQLAERALDLPLVQKSDRWLGIVYELLSGIYCELGNTDKSIQLSHELIRLGDKYNIPHHIAYGHRRLAQVYLREGKLAQARFESVLSGQWWSEANNEAMALHAELETTFIRMLVGEKAEAIFKESELLLDTILESPKGYGYRDYALALTGIIAREAGQLQQAEEWLGCSAASSRKRGAKQLLAGTLLNLAELYLLQGEEEQADYNLREALGIAQVASIDTFWDWHPETVYKMCQRGVLKNIYSEWALHILERWFSNRICREANYLLINKSENVRTSTFRFLQNKYLQKGTPIIHANFLGKFQVFLNGREIPSSHWKTKKVENVFKYLLLERSPQPKEKIITAIWPEADSCSNDASLRMALSHIRQALTLSENNKAGVLLKRGMVYLEPELKIYTDYELFISVSKKILSEADRHSHGSLEFIEYATQLYQGDFLPENIYDDWTFSQRRKLQDLYLRILLKSIRFYVQLGQNTRALELCHICLALEPTDERIIGMTMELLSSIGQKHKALSIYKNFAKHLAEEYELEPSVELLKLSKKICRMS